MKARYALLAACAAFIVFLQSACAEDEPVPLAPTFDSGNYVLSPNDVIQLKVYREPDLETKVRIGKDGSASFPLIGNLIIGGKKLEEATRIIETSLNKDYLVNPQVSISVVEYAKRRFTVLGQVQRPGNYEIPNEEKVTLLQAIGMAGGYTRLAEPSRITVKRQVAGKETMFQLNARAMAKDNGSQPFEIQPEDTITAGERIF